MRFPPLLIELKIWQGVDWVVREEDNPTVLLSGHADTLDGAVVAAAEARTQFLAREAAYDELIALLKIYKMPEAAEEIRQKGRLQNFRLA